MEGMIRQFISLQKHFCRMSQGRKHTYLKGLKDTNDMSLQTGLGRYKQVAQWPFAKTSIVV